MIKKIFKFILSGIINPSLIFVFCLLHGDPVGAIREMRTASVSDGFRGEPGSVTNAHVNQIADTCNHASTPPALRTTFPDQSENSVLPLDDFDVRDQKGDSLRLPTENRKKASERIRHQRGDKVIVYWNHMNGTPRSFLNFEGYLSNPSQEKPKTRAIRFLRDNPDLFGLTEDDLSNLKITREFRSRHNSVTHLSFGQYYKGIPVFQGQLSFNIDKQGRILNLGGEYYPGAVVSITPELSPGDALKNAAQSVAPGIYFEPEILSGPSGPTRRVVFQKGPFNRTDAFHNAELVIFPVQDEFRLAWQIIFHKSSIERYALLVDANSGAILYRSNLVKFNQPQGLVFEENPDDTPQVIQSFQGNPAASPAGWLYENNGIYSTLGGNNTCTQEDRNGDNVPGYSPGAPDGHFEFLFMNAYENSGGTDVDTDLDAAITNLFYQVNFIHDYYYNLGFDAAAGNFQRYNFGGGGLGNDEVHADAQDAWDLGARNNANFFTPRDGFKPRMQMYLFTSPPLMDVDSAFAGEVIIHEYTHGLSIRLVGGPQNVFVLSGIQGGAMGEGWGDWFPASIFDDPVAGEYPTGNLITGVRRYSLDNNPLTYGDLCQGPRGCEVHDDGELWSATLWNLRQNFIDKYGHDTGKQQVEQLVVDGMMFSIANPSMLDMRNAVLVADIAGNSGANQDIIWDAFACRGMGYSASTSGPGDQNPLEAFDLPDGRDCRDTSSKNYDIWISPSFSSPPFNPFHDCLRVNSTGTQVTIDGLGTSSDAVVETGQAGIWIAIFPVSGVDDYFFYGTFLSLGENDVISGSGIAIANGWTFGSGGQENANCFLSQNNAGSTYVPFNSP